ncbi:flagellar motor protein MotB [Rhodopila globiformis]|uniref:Chemotaxis protein MotB n=1 Tax=Rhodopila globiformis TaxID=1071 RepID=A0A2S6MZ13_RHOGL|nr:flagellar motor protein MotB [Rhodopila globiformis]PPQ27615.1 chemotaxis protein MotB [Rhodopila globiformis]
MSDPKHAKRPIIVKRHAGHDDEHGGQWKVAYADFVTAMMAFFLIMWLLATMTQSQRVVIARYFSTSSIFDLPSGNGVLSGGKSVMNGDTAAPHITASLKRRDNGGGSGKAGSSEQSNRDRMERQRFEALKAEIERMEQTGRLQGLASHLSLEMTEDGLRIQIFDRDGEPMFAAGSYEPTPRLSMILGVVSEVLATVQNSIIISGHTDAQALQRPNYSNWELSADRANAVRRRMVADGLATSRFVDVEGRAATEPLVPQDPDNPRNRRIAVTILRNAAALRLRQNGRADTAAQP